MNKHCTFISCVPKKSCKSRLTTEISNNRVNFNENPSMRAIAKILRTRASEHLFKFCEQIEQRPNFASALNSNGPFYIPNTFCALYVYSYFVNY